MNHDEFLSKETDERDQLVADVLKGKGDEGATNEQIRDELGLTDKSIQSVRDALRRLGDSIKKEQVTGSTKKRYIWKDGPVCRGCGKPFKTTQGRGNHEKHCDQYPPDEDADQDRNEDDEPDAEGYVVEVMYVGHTFTSGVLDSKKKAESLKRYVVENYTEDCEVVAV